MTVKTWLCRRRQVRDSVTMSSEAGKFLSSSCCRVDSRLVVVCVCRGRQCQCWLSSYFGRVLLSLSMWATTGLYRNAQWEDEQVGS